MLWSSFSPNSLSPVSPISQAQLLGNLLQNKCQCLTSLGWASVSPSLKWSHQPTAWLLRSPQHKSTRNALCRLSEVSAVIPVLCPPQRAPKALEIDEEVGGGISLGEPWGCLDWTDVVIKKLDASTSLWGTVSLLPRVMLHRHSSLISSRQI